jgi:hypothetical protein
MLADPNATVSVASGDTAQLRLALQSTRLPAGLYTGQIEFRAKPATGNADPITQITTVEMRIRDSAIWPLLTVVLGIVLGRVAQLVYDPQVIAKVQLLDWIHQLETRIAQVKDNAARDALGVRLGTLRTQLFSRGVDVAALQTAFPSLAAGIEHAAAPGQQATLGEASATVREITECPAQPLTRPSCKMSGPNGLQCVGLPISPVEPARALCGVSRKESFARTYCHMPVPSHT